MKVYVLETGCYEDRDIHGVYATPEAAMAAWHPAPPIRQMLPAKIVFDSATGATVDLPERPASRWTYTWSRKDWGWEFDADFDDAADITEYEVEG